VNEIAEMERLIGIEKKAGKHRQPKRALKFREARARKKEKRRAVNVNLRGHWVRKAVLLALVVVFGVGLANTVFWNGKAAMINMGKYSEHQYVQYMIDMDSRLLEIDSKLREETAKFGNNSADSVAVQDEYRKSCDEFKDMVFVLETKKEQEEVPDMFTRGACLHDAFIDLVKIRFQSGDAVLNYFAGGDDVNLQVADTRLKDFELLHEEVMGAFANMVIANKL